MSSDDLRNDTFVTCIRDETGENLPKFDVHGVSKSIPRKCIQENFTQIDFLSNEYKERLRLLKDNFQPDVVINSSGMTSLALCEKDNAIANFLNGESF